MASDMRRARAAALLNNTCGSLPELTEHDRGKQWGGARETQRCPVLMMAACEHARTHTEHGRIVVVQKVRESVHICKYLFVVCLFFCLTN